jgi:hypothetical protein
MIFLFNLFKMNCIKLKCLYSGFQLNTLCATRWKLKLEILDEADSALLKEYVRIMSTLDKYLDYLQSEVNSYMVCNTMHPKNQRSDARVANLATNGYGKYSPRTGFKKFIQKFS